MMFECGDPGSTAKLAPIAHDCRSMAIAGTAQKLHCGDLPAPDTAGQGPHRTGKPWWGQRPGSSTPIGKSGSSFPVSRCLASPDSSPETGRRSRIPSAPLRQRPAGRPISFTKPSRKTMAGWKCDGATIRSRLMLSNLATVTSCPSTVVTNGRAGSCSICLCRYFVPNFDVLIIFARYHCHPEPRVARLAHFQFAGADRNRRPGSVKADP